MKTRSSLLLTLSLLAGALSFSQTAAAQRYVAYDVPNKNISWRIGVGSNGNRTYIIWKKGLSGGESTWNDTCFFQQIGNSYDLFAGVDTLIRGGNKRDEIYVVTGNEEFRLCNVRLGPIITRSSSVAAIKIEGWGGDDIIWAGDKVRSIKGGRGHDWIVGTGENQYINGDEENDYILVSPDVWRDGNRVYGSYHNDYVCFFPDSVPDTQAGILHGGLNTDTLVGARPAQKTASFENKVLQSSTCFYLGLAVVSAIANGENNGDL